jgi:hypothetical protein
MEYIRKKKLVLYRILQNSTVKNNLDAYHVIRSNNVISDLYKMYDKKLPNIVNGIH